MEHDTTYYDTLATGYDALHKDEQVAKIHCILQHTRLTPDQTLLDVGCGTAFSFNYFPCQCHGAEPSPGLIAQSAHKQRITRAYGEHLPFPDASFDVVTCITALHNFQNPLAGLHEMRRVGKTLWIFSLLKRSPKTPAQQNTINQIFAHVQCIDQGTDLIYLCRATP
ncbi:MAG: methyltransferase domain-containing protein [Nitrosarchaeum sp.]|nr:methyltransferase domain-containing protein [Nitrosarchaeum sp.]